MSSILLVPLDGRPCNHSFPQEMAALAGFSLSCPQKEILGNAQTPARRDRIQAWLNTQIAQTKTLIVSLDTWVYGNLVASRKTHESLEILSAQLDLFSRIKETYPKIKIQAFATLLRISNSNDATEERVYWAQHGRQIYRYSWLEHYLQSHENDLKAQAEYAKLKSLIPDNVLSNYLDLRNRNFSILLRTLEMVESAVLDNLLIGCDDTGNYGWNAIERHTLHNEIEARNLQAKVSLYPGADELAQVLLGRSLVSKQPRILIRWTYPDSKNLKTLYEGSPLWETVRHQAQACQLKLVEEPDDNYDAVLWLHNPLSKQIDQFLDRSHRVPEAKEPLQDLLHLLKQDTPVFIADLMYANGGDHYLLKQLETAKLLFHPKGYAAWNTNGNTLGTIFAWSKLVHSEHLQKRLQQKFLIERITDDGWYQGVWRQELSQHYSDPVNLNICVALMHKINQHLKRWLEWMPNPPACLEVKYLNFPWRRFFEIELHICFKSQNDD